jgi:hypothetical protein
MLLVRDAGHRNGAGPRFMSVTANVDGASLLLLDHAANIDRPRPSFVADAWDVDRPRLLLRLELANRDGT